MRWRAVALGFLTTGVLACTGIMAVWWTTRVEVPTWRTTTIHREAVRQTVTAVGALEPVTQVEVGTQVSGVVAELLVDYNDHVEAGQVIARIDPTILEADMRAATARRDVARAQKQSAEADQKRIASLVAGGAASDQEKITADTAFAIASAQAREADIALDRAKRNLDYSTITSPISGVVVSRAVDLGQTVNAGMSAPTLFVIAGDLAQLQIVAAVDEADVGRIAVDQIVEFTVQAYPETTFKGRVQQVRLQSTLVENVVTYGVVVAADNPEGKLLPGMTATLDFVVAEAPDALCVEAAALRFRPEETWIRGAPVATPSEAPKTDGKGGPPGATASATPGGGGAPSGASGGRGKGGGRRGGGAPKLWVVDGDGVRPMPVKTGIVGSDCTEVDGDAVADGLTVVIGVERSGDAASSNPFQPAGSSGNNRRPPGAF